MYGSVFEFTACENSHSAGFSKHFFRNLNIFRKRMALEVPIIAGADFYPLPGLPPRGQVTSPYAFKLLTMSLFRLISPPFQGGVAGTGRNEDTDRLVSLTWWLINPIHDVTVLHKVRNSGLLLFMLMN
jgi:hypothetical protein